MKTVEAITFYCPNCNQHFEVESLRSGADFQCTECLFNFRPGDSITKAVVKEQLSMAEAEQQFQNKEAQRLFGSAEGMNGFGTFLIILGAGSEHR